MTIVNRGDCVTLKGQYVGMTVVKITSYEVTCGLFSKDFVYQEVVFSRDAGNCNEDVCKVSCLTKDQPREFRLR